MIPHKDAQRILEKALRHLERKLDLVEECPECGCSPVTSGELQTLFNYLGRIEGVEGVAHSEPQATAKPAGPVAFPVKKAETA